MNEKIVSTGQMLETYLVSNNITLDMLAKKANVSWRTIYRIINDQTRINFNIANAINELIPEIKIEFIMAYDGVYQARKKAIEKNLGYSNIDEIILENRLSKFYPKYKKDKFALISIQKNIFDNDNKNCNSILSRLKYSFCKAKGSNEDVSLEWLALSFREYCIINDDNLLKFDNRIFDIEFRRIKDYIATSSIDSAIFNMDNFCKKCGINFYFRENVAGSRIKAVTIKDSYGRVFIFVSSLFKCLENLWISFVHECKHIQLDEINGLDKEYPNGKNEFYENYIAEESIHFFVGDKMNDNRDYKVDEIVDISKNCNVQSSIVAEIARYRSKDYCNSDINGYIHYYKNSSLKNGLLQSFYDKINIKY